MTLMKKLRLYKSRSGWFGDSLRHSLARKYGRSGLYKQKVSTFQGPRLFSRRRNGQIIRNISYAKHLQGLKTQQDLKVREAKIDLAKKAISKILPPAGTAIEGYEIAKDAHTILTNGRIKKDRTIYD